MHLRQIRNVLGNLLGRIAFQRLVVVDDFAHARRDGLGDGFEQAGLAAAVLPDDGDDLAARNIQRYVLQHGFSVEADGHVSEAEVH